MLANTTAGAFTVTVPSAPAVADPITTLVTDPDTPPVPRFTALTAAATVAPVPIPTVDATTEVPSARLVPASVTLGELTSVAPKAPAIADPIVTLVVDPETPPVPRSTALTTAEAVAPVPMP